MRALNEEFIPDNVCFGCGLANPDGMHIHIYRDGARTDGLVGTYAPRATHGGFPQIVHGGLQFTALDCMAGWCVFILRAQGQPLMPLTKAATMRYLRPARVGGELRLTADIVREASSPKDSMAIRATIGSTAGEVFSEADFEYVALPADRFLKAVGLDALPDTYRRHFGEA